MGYVFISYSSMHQSTANATRDLLISKGIDCWMAPFDIPSGSDYAGVINDAVENCACFLLLLTSASQDSVWVNKEVNLAVSYGKTIITVKLEDIELNSSFKFYLNNSQVEAVKAIDENNSEMNKVIKAVSVYVHSSSGSELNTIQAVIQEDKKEQLYKRGVKLLERHRYVYNGSDSLIWDSVAAQNIFKSLDNYLDSDKMLKLSEKLCEKDKRTNKKEEILRWILFVITGVLMSCMLTLCFCFHWCVAFFIPIVTTIIGYLISRSIHIPKNSTMFDKAWVPLTIWFITSVLLCVNYFSNLHVLWIILSIVGIGVIGGIIATFTLILWDTNDEHFGVSAKDDSIVKDKNS